MTDEYGANKYIVTYGEHTYDKYALSSRTAPNKMVTSGMTANAYNGCRLYILTGSYAGRLYHIIYNTTTDIFVQENNVGDLGGTEQITIESRFVVPGATVRNLFVQIAEDLDFPTPNYDMEEIWAHGVGQDRHVFVHRKQTFDYTIPTIVQNMRFPFLLFGGGGDYGTQDGTKGGTSSGAVYPHDILINATGGHTIDASGTMYQKYVRIDNASGTDTGVSTALSGVHSANLTTLTLTGTTGLGVGDTIGIDTADATGEVELRTIIDIPTSTTVVIDAPTFFAHANTDVVKQWVAPFNYPEVRSYTIATNALTLDKPLRYYHASGCPIRNVIAPYEHYIVAENTMPYFDVCGVYTTNDPANYKVTTTPGNWAAITVRDFIRDAYGSKFVSGEFSSSPDSLLTFNAELRALGVTTGTTVPYAVNVPSTTGYQYRMVSGGIYMGVTAGTSGISHLELEQLTYRLERNLATYWTHQSTSTDKPFYHVEAKRKHSLTLGFIPQNTSIYDMVTGKSSLCISGRFERGTNDWMVMTFANCYIPNAPHGMTMEGAVKVTADVHPGSIPRFTVRDSIPHYPGGK